MADPQLVLVVDDEPDVLVLCEVNLELEGFAVRTASDGREALVAVAAERPDVILLDVKLPHLDGFAALERLQADPATADIPVILLTARTLPGDQIRGWKGGAADYLTKPFDPSVLVATVRQTLAGQGRGRTRRLELAQLELEARLAKQP